MKANWKIALVCLAAIAMVACDKKNDPTQLTLNKTEITVAVGDAIQLTANMEVTWSSNDPKIATIDDKGLVTGVAQGETAITARAVQSNESATCKVTVTKKGEGGGEGGGTDSTYVNPISIKDKSIADWDKLDKSKVAVYKMTSDPLYTALKEIKVYADKLYINYVITFDPAEMESHGPEDFMHIYIDADNSDETGGYWDQFDGPNQGNTDLMFEGSLWDEAGTQISYNPSVWEWAGPLNGEGWNWELLPSGSTIGGSQFVEDGIVEGRLVKQYIPWNNWADQFSIGFDIQQNSESVGLLPQIDTPDGEHIGRAKKLLVTFNK